MIAQLLGKIAYKSPTQSIIDCQGVGYEVFHTPFAAEKLKLGESAQLFIHAHVREDCFHLYGFINVEEKEVFRELLKVSAVGPKLALSILSGIQHQELVMALQQKDLGRLQKIPGIGKKTAERLTLELADRMAKNPKILADKTFSSPGSQKEQELESILINLGYQKAEVSKVIPGFKEALDSEAIESVLKKALGALTDVSKAARIN